MAQDVAILINPTEPRHDPTYTRLPRSLRKLKDILQADLNFLEKDYSDPRHTWHAFAAKFPPQLPRYFIRHLSEEHEVVLDPMMGSCTTLLEAVSLKRDAIGIDLDPLSLLIGRAKFARISPAHVWEQSRIIVNDARKQFDSQRDELRANLEGRFDEPTLVFLRYWFAENTCLELLYLLQMIENIKIIEERLFFQMIFSSIIVTKSGGVSLARDLAHTRPHRVFSKTINSAIDEFDRRVKKILQKAKAKSNEHINLIEGNVRNIPLADNSVDLIVTSPPYANNAIDYMRAHKFSLVWLSNHGINTSSKTISRF